MKLVFQYGSAYNNNNAKFVKKKKIVWFDKL